MERESLKNLTDYELEFLTSYYTMMILKSQTSREDIKKIEVQLDKIDIEIKRRISLK